jgi:L-iditol 2-dehydrogenase
MKAIVKYTEGEGNIEVRDVEEPQCGPGQVKIEVKAAGICGSDIHIWHSDIAIPMKLPVVIGHEFSGQIVDVGEGVEKFQPGDRVTAETTFESCEKCYHCNSGNYNLCLQRRGIGYWYNGAFTKYIIINQQRLYKLPENISYEEGAMSEPLSCITHAALELTAIQPTDLVVISGPGPIGLLTLQVVNSLGAEVYLCGVTKDAQQLELGKKLGAARIIDVQKEPLNEIIAERTGGIGADVVLECSGNARAASTGFDIIKKGGQYTQIGLFGAPITLDFAKIAYKEIKATGSFSQKWSAWLHTMELLRRNKIDLKSLISHKFKIDEWEKAFNMAQSGDGLKIIFSID